MKIKTCFIVFAFAALAAVGLVGCSEGSIEAISIEEGPGMHITANNANSDCVVEGSLVVEEGQCVCISPVMDKGALHVTMAVAGEEAAIDEDFDGRVLTYIEVAPGEYAIQVSGVKGSTGEMFITAPAIADVAAMDASLAEEMDRNGTDPSTVGLANPWTYDLESATDAAMVAGITDFHAPVGNESDLGEPISVTYGAMAGLAEAQYEFPASAMTIRKGIATVADDQGDISGDYNVYEHTWTATIAGREVTCFGNREGDAAKTIWKDSNDMYYSITVQGLGGDTDFGLNEERLEAFIAQVA